MEFNEITVMQAWVKVLSPLLKDDLGVLLQSDGTATTQPAIYLADNQVPESTLPRVVLSYQGSQNGFTTNRTTYQENNPDYDPLDPDSPEFLYFIRRENHTEFAISFSIESGSTVEVLQNNKSSAPTLARKIRKLLARHSVRDSIHTEAECGVDYIAQEIPVRDLEGFLRTDASTLLISNLTYCDEDIEQVDGVIDSVEYQGTLYEVSEEDPDPLVVNRVFTAPDSY